MMTTAEQVRESNHAELDRLRMWLMAPAIDSPPGVGRLIHKFAVSGSRTWTDPWPIEYVLWRMPYGATMLNGMAAGVDTLARQCWERRGGVVDPVPVTGQMWRDLGRRAGIVRNEIMLNRMPECLLAWQQGGSPGTAHAIAYATKLGIPTFVFRS